MYSSVVVLLMLGRSMTKVTPSLTLLPINTGTRAIRGAGAVELRRLSRGVSCKVTPPSGGGVLNLSCRRSVVSLIVLAGTERRHSRGSWEEEQLTASARLFHTATAAVSLTGARSEAWSDCIIAARKGRGLGGVVMRVRRCGDEGIDTSGARAFPKYCYLSGSPPKAAMLRYTQSRARRWSSHLYIQIRDLAF